MKKRILYFIPVGGLANRMRTINAAICLCRKFNRSIKIIWFKDKALNSTYSSLFEPITLPDVEIREAKPIDYILLDRPRKRNFFIPWIFQKVFFIKQIYELEAHQRAINNDGFRELDLNGPIYLTSYSRLIRSNIDSSIFKPIAEIQSELDLFSEKIKTCIGVHIRRGDHVLSISESPVELFVNQMKKEVETNPDVCFYLATDSDKVKTILTERFGKHIITSNRTADRLSESGMKDAVLDLYFLASTKKILGSYNSTFSNLAAELGGLEFIEIKNEQLGT